MYVRERYRAQAMAANAVQRINGSSMGGFLCTIAGALAVADINGQGYVTALPVSAGVYYPLPLVFASPAGGTVTLSGGAAGTLFV